MVLLMLMTMGYGVLMMLIMICLPGVLGQCNASSTVVKAALSRLLACLTDSLVNDWCCSCFCRKQRQVKVVMRKRKRLEQQQQQMLLVEGLVQPAEAEPQVRLLRYVFSTLYVGLAQRFTVHGVGMLIRSLALHAYQAERFKRHCLT